MPVAEAIANPSRRWSRRQVLLGRCLGMVFGIVLPLLILEVSLRLIGPWLPGYYETGLYLQRDQRLGHVHVPNYTGWLKTPEYTTYIRINPLGQRDPRTSYDKPPGTFRILFLGDSFLEAVQVQEREGIAAQLEAALNEGAPRHIEVINAGVAAYGTAQELLLLEDDVYRYQPDVVVLLFYVWNDVKNNSYRLEIPDRKIQRALKPYFDIDKQGNLNLISGPPPAPVPPAIATLRGCCWLYNVIESSIYGSLGRRYPRQELEVLGGPRNPERGMYERNLDEEWVQAWRLTEALLARMRDRSQTLGAPFVIAGAPGPEFDLAAWRDTVGGNRLASNQLDADAPMTRLQDVAGRLGVPYISLLPPLRQATEAGSGPLSYAIDGHWRPIGHAIAARALAEGLVANGLAGR